MQSNKIFITFFLLLCFVACQKIDGDETSISNEVNTEFLVISEEQLVLDADKGLVLYQEEPFTGQAVAYYDNQSLALTKDFVNGKKHGYFKKWFPDGLLSFESAYENGFQQGRTATWWSNGNIRSDSNYNKGVPDGVQYQYYISGAKFKMMNLKKGREDGLQQSWRENGKLYNNYEAKDGRIFGLKRASLCFQLDNEIVQHED